MEKWLKCQSNINEKPLMQAEATADCLRGVHWVCDCEGHGGLDVNLAGARFTRTAGCSRQLNNRRVVYISNSAKLTLRGASRHRPGASKNYL